MLSVLMLIVSCAQEESEDTIGQQVDRFTNVYGLAYNPKIPHDLYLGTRYGLVRMNAQQEWSYTSEREHRHGLLSFTFLDQDTMISSGHPAVESDFEDPLGLIISTDLGETWEPLALQDEVDFHVMEVNATDSSVIYGLDAFGKGLHRSQNHGEDWVALEAAGFTETYPDFIFSLVSDPGNPNALLAGTQQGVFSSDDGGETWELIDTTYTMLSAKGVPDKREQLWPTHLDLPLA